MANEQNLRFRATYDDSQFQKGTKRTQATLNNVNKSVKNQGQAFTQLAYALDDAQYGFRGIQNNLQAIAVSAGLSGPIVLGITAMTVALGYVINNWDSFGSTATAALRAVNEELQKQQTEVAKVQLFVSLLGQVEENSNSAAVALKKLRLNEFDTSAANRYLRLAEATAKYRALEAAFTGEIAKGLTEIVELQSINVDTNFWHQLSTYFTGLWGALTGGEDAHITPEEHLANRLQAIRDRLSSFAPKFGEELEKLFAQFPEFEIPEIIGDSTVIEEASTESGKTAGEKFGEAFKSAIQNSIAGFARTIGEVIGGDGDLGSGFLKVLGSFMQTLGGAMIAIGIAKTNFDTLLATFGGGPGIIAAGAALVAAGAAISASASRGAAASSGYSSGGGQRSASTTGGSSPFSIQGSGGFVIRGQDLRYIGQAAGDSYRGLN